MHISIRMMLVGITYYVGAWFGVNQTITAEGIAIFWPPNAVLLAAFLLFPHRQWPLMGLAALAAELIAGVPGFPLWAALAFGLVNLFEASLGAWLIRYFVSGRFDFDKLSNAATFVLFGPLLASASAALFGAAIYVLLGRADSSYLLLWRLWWFGDALGLLLLTPLLVTLWRRLQNRPRLFLPRFKRSETTALVAIALLLATLVFFQGAEIVEDFVFTPILLIPLGIWSAFHFGLLGASLTVVLIAILAVDHLMGGLNPYPSITPQQAVLLTQEHIAIIAVVSLGLAVMWHEISQQRRTMQQQENDLQAHNVLLEQRIVERTKDLEHANQSLQVANQRLTYMAQHDILTGLPNRTLFTDRLDVAIVQAKRSGKPLALLFMDLDRFKNVNDVFGHALGDGVLSEVAIRLATCVRASDTVSRQGGDEFTVILTELDHIQDAARVAEKLLAVVASPFIIDGTEVVVGISIGIACFPENGRDATALLSNADAAMYVAKKESRHHYQFYSASMNAWAQGRLTLESDLRHAIKRDELFVMYQPQVDLATGAIVGLEALARWRHPTQGLISPDTFIPLAEECGLIVTIGAWVLETACRHHALWVAENLIVGTVAVNVSAHQFRQPEFVEKVEQVLVHSGLSAAHLELEVSESVVMQDLHEVMDKLEKLHRLGVKLAIDDFGTGYSSLSYLKKFPIHRLKIDQSFTRGLPGDRENSAITQAIISMGRSLELDVLAEGIETREQEAYLRSLACHRGQGYLYARPFPATECADYLRSHEAALLVSR
ncbi:EAL domain-containing protein [Halomonas sp. TRM85114]|uniref:putative bifunctional diguanylate cyclase/phosphodiesterase n=1 Tax=Halomonas jincaotanensis TaxID=2810616 RepID=UPI001BD2B1B7|nr:EAL domain-containing protein [Halomonas jincaotanensis]MBS9405301.1 EAL domain-containing protein [Halomonas jincaotanensis]